jgi:hypothetical protein
VRRDSLRKVIARARARAFPHPTLAGIPPRKRTAEQRAELDAWNEPHRFTPNMLRYARATELARRRACLCGVRLGSWFWRLRGLSYQEASQCPMGRVALGVAPERSHSSACTVVVPRPSERALRIRTRKVARNASSAA